MLYYSLFSTIFAIPNIMCFYIFSPNNLIISNIWHIQPYAERVILSVTMLCGEHLTPNNSLERASPEFILPVFVSRTLWTHSICSTLICTPATLMQFSWLITSYSSRVTLATTSCSFCSFANTYGQIGTNDRRHAQYTEIECTLDMSGFQWKKCQSGWKDI